MCWFCCLHMLVYVVFPTCLSWFSSMCMLVALHVHVLGVEPWLHLVLSYWLLWEINGSSHFGGVTCFVHFTILKMCVHEEYHLVLIFCDYLVSMWYVMLMRNSNSTIPINHLLLDFICLLYENKWFITLRGSNMPCAYFKPRKCEHLRYCHL